MERQPQVNALQEIASSLLLKGHRGDYIEAEEKVHVIEKKLKQLLEQVSQDLVSLQQSQVGPLVASKYKNVCEWESSVAALLGEGGHKHVAAVTEEPCPFVLCGPNKLPKLFKAASSFVRGRRQRNPSVWLGVRKTSRVPPSFLPSRLHCSHLMVSGPLPVLVTLL